MRAIYVLFVALALGGCATRSHFETIYGSWVGQPFKTFQEAYGTADATHTDRYGNTIYQYKLKSQKDCLIYWVVNPKGVIIRWWHEGNCKLAPFG